MLVGWIVGCLINTLADQLPLGQGLSLRPRCVHCNTPRHPIQYSGIVAYRARRAACAQCGRALGWRWLVVELVSILVFGYLAALYGSVLPLSNPASLFILQLTPALLLSSFYSSLLLLISVIDFEHRLILRVVIFPAIAAAALLSLVSPGLTPGSALVGGAVGFMLTGIIYLGGKLFVHMQARRGRVISEVAFGQGDVWLMLFVGLIVGLSGVLRALVLGVLLGGAVAAAILVFGVVRRESKLYVPFAYGPYLAVAGWIVLLQNFLAR